MSDHPVQPPCRKCGGAMRLGIAMWQTVTGAPDFPGDKHATTLSPGGPGVVVPCLKCSACGWSVSLPAEPLAP